MSTIMKNGRKNQGSNGSTARPEREFARPEREFARPEREFRPAPKRGAEAAVSDPATPTKPNSYRTILEKKAEEVRNSMSAQKAAQLVSRLDVPSDEGDLSQQHHEEWIFLNRNTIDMKLLREISDALRRIDQGHYGICLECEEAISQKRLDAVPWARYCVGCQEKIAARIAMGDLVDEYEEAPK
jgi:DnaK suppressor protein